MASGGPGDGEHHHANEGGEGENPGEATLLVSEFPPPPFYYQAAAHLTPPEIPQEALARGTKRAAAAAARARAESERLRLGEDDPDKTDAILGGPVPAVEEEEGDVVAVFGEIVEVSSISCKSSFSEIIFHQTSFVLTTIFSTDLLKDPLLVEPLDPCEDPTVIRDEVKR